MREADFVGGDTDEDKTSGKADIIQRVAHALVAASGVHDHRRERAIVSLKSIRIRGAREHNLKNLTVDIPRDQLVVITGL